MEGIEGFFAGLAVFIRGVSAFIIYLFGCTGACEKLVPIETSLVKESFGMIVFKGAFEECTDFMERSMNYMMFEKQSFAS